MLQAIYERSFLRDIEKAKKRGKDMQKLASTMELIGEGKPLPPKYKEHKLKGEYQGYWECHIEPDWLLVYKKTATTVAFAYTGTHSDLF